MFTPAFLTLVAVCTAMTVAITQTVKNALGLKKKRNKVASIIISLVVSAVVSLAQGEIGPEGFQVQRYLLLTLITFLQANGVYLFTKQMIDRVRTDGP